MNKLLLALSILISLSGAALARVGETFEECVQRYGILQRVESQFRPEYPQYCFKLGDVEIRVRFYLERSAQEMYMGADGKLLTSQQKDEILASNRENPARTKWDIDYGRRGNSDILIITELDFDKVWRKETGSGF
jgi:predicted transcriptional regulator